jgi:hypothetical protein
MVVVLHEGFKELVCATAGHKPSPDSNTAATVNCMRIGESLLSLRMDLIWMW